MYECIARLTILQWLLSAALITIGYVLVQTVYRLTLHPLAKYPGPFVSKISDWSIPWQCTTGDRHILHWKEHQTYGPIVRIGPNTLSFSAPRALRQIYQPGKENNALRKAAYYDTIDAPSGAYSLHSETSRSKHAARRRVLDHAFTAAALRSNEPYMIDAIDTVCKMLAPDDDEEWSSSRNMKSYLNWFAYDVMGELVFGRRFECLTESTHRFVPEMIMTSSVFLYIAAHLPFQWLVRPIISSHGLMKMFGGQLVRDEYAYIEYANACMAERLAKEDTGNLLEKGVGTDRRDMMHYIIQGRKSATTDDYSRKALDSDASLLIAAGSDTTSATLAGLMFYLTLSSSKAILERLTDEIRDPNKFPNSQSITGSAVGSLTYLRACIDEALRLAPPTPGHLPRTIVKKGGLEIDGHMIPTGTTVGASAYVLHHDETAYPNSWSFNPDRWLFDQNPSPDRMEEVRRAKEAFIPFSLGSRGCIGKDLAYREMCLCIARLVYQFDFRRVEASTRSKEQ